MPDYQDEKPVSWYNEYYSKPLLQLHYTNSPRRFLWEIIAYRILSEHPTPKYVLDLGCGCAELGNILHDQGLKNYIGIDYSQTAIGIGNSFIPSYYCLIHGDLKTVVFPDNCTHITMIEVLEHIKDDISILKRIKKNTVVYLSVPSFKADSHVRYFKNKHEVISRYGTLFVNFDITSYYINPISKIYLLRGIKK